MIPRFPHPLTKFPVADVKTGLPHSLGEQPPNDDIQLTGGLPTEPQSVLDPRYTETQMHGTFFASTLLASSSASSLSTPLDSKRETTTSTPCALPLLSLQMLKHDGINLRAHIPGDNLWRNIYVQTPEGSAAVQGYKLGTVNDDVFVMFDQPPPADCDFRPDRLFIPQSRNYAIYRFDSKEIRYCEVPGQPHSHTRVSLPSLEEGVQALQALVGQQVFLATGNTALMPVQLLAAVGSNGKLILEDKTTFVRASDDGLDDEMPPVGSRASSELTRETPRFLIQVRADFKPDDAPALDVDGQEWLSDATVWGLRDNKDGTHTWVTQVDEGSGCIDVLSLWVLQGGATGSSSSSISSSRIATSSRGVSHKRKVPEPSTAASDSLQQRGAQSRREPPLPDFSALRQHTPLAVNGFTARFFATDPAQPRTLWVDADKRIPGSSLGALESKEAGHGRMLHKLDITLSAVVVRAQA